jgi:hypothetical protein
MSDPTQKPGKGFLGWLGRQVGYVKQAVKTDVTAPPPPPAERKLYEHTTVHESPHPTDPDVKLRRTIIDEAVQAPASPDVKGEQKSL